MAITIVHNTDTQMCMDLCRPFQCKMNAIHFKKKSGSSGTVVASISVSFQNNSLNSVSASTSYERNNLCFDRFHNVKCN